MSRLLSAAKATVASYSFQIAGLILSLVTVPLYLTWLGAARYGMMLTALACAGYLMFTDAGLSWSSMLLISHAQGRKDREAVARIVRSSVVLATLSVCLVCAIALGAWWLLLMLSVSHPEWSKELPGLSLAVGAQVASSLALSPFYSLLTGMQDAHVAATYQGTGRILAMFAALTAAWLGFPLGCILVAGTIFASAVGIVAAVHAVRRYRWAFVRGLIWDLPQVRAQCRTGFKSFGLQIGRVMASSAPVFALSSQAGAHSVPNFTVPYTLLNTPLSVFTSFNTYLQAAYGDAAGSNDLPWVAHVLQTNLRQLTLLNGLLAAGFLVLAKPALDLWTRNQLNVPMLMIGSVLAIGLCGSFLTVFQFVLAGLNRHRKAAFAEIWNGVLCLMLCPLIVRILGPSWVGVAIIACSIVTTARVFTREAKHHLHIDHVWPSQRFLVRVLTAFALALGMGWSWRQTFFSLFPGSPWIAVASTAIMIVSVYIAIIYLLLPDEVKQSTARLQRLLRRGQ